MIQQAPKPLSALLSSSKTLQVVMTAEIHGHMTGQMISEGLVAQNCINQMFISLAGCWRLPLWV